MQQPTISSPFGYLMGFNAGFVDTAGFLALNGLFTAHVTGNFVTLAAALIHNGSGTLAKIMALPVFCLMVVLSRYLANRHDTHKRAVILLLVLQVLFLLCAAVVLITTGPQLPHMPETWPAFWGGMLLVAAMGIQNAMQRMHLTSMAPSALMTGNTTQLMIDLTDLLEGVRGEPRAVVVQRLRKMGPAILSFALGCAVAALGYYGFRMWCFVVPPVIAALLLVFLPRWDQPAARPA